jgi:hypothetical protein
LSVDVEIVISQLINRFIFEYPIRLHKNWTINRKNAKKNKTAFNKIPFCKYTCYLNTITNWLTDIYQLQPEICLFVFRKVDQVNDLISRSELYEKTHKKKQLHVYLTLKVQNWNKTQIFYKKKFWYFFFDIKSHYFFSYLNPR